MGYSKPYTKKGVYYAGDSGLTEADFRSQRSAGTLSPANLYSPNGGTQNYNTPNANVIDTRLGGPVSGSGTQNAPWYQSDLQATPTGIFLDNSMNTGANFGRGWDSDPNLANVSNAIPQMLGYDEGTKKYDTSKGSILGGPGQAYDQGTLQNLYGLGAQALRNTNKAMFAGAANAEAARGGTGFNFANIMAGRDAGDRGALARANLDARTKGLELGVNQYNSRLGAFNQIGSLADAQAGRDNSNQKLDFSKMAADKAGAMSAVENARAAMNNYANAHATELAQSSGSEDSGKQAKDYFRKMLQDLQRQYQYAQSNLSRYA